ncbi:hypothetical protein [Actibacterium pelagium]|uniref:hypothetical protein n=1 Tax=Actibacterium pelagium TaxID=2029103 RepID=UPI001178C6D1|nr:hypothetical protein [Actibacterium pelagium]
MSIVILAGFVTGLSLTLVLNWIAGKLPIFRWINPYRAGYLATFLSGIPFFVLVGFICGSSCAEFGIGLYVVLIGTVAGFGGASAGVMIALYRARK